MSTSMVPTRLFFTKGLGKHKDRLTSYAIALREAGVGSQNLVRISSIYPPLCRLVPRKEGLKSLQPGQVVFAVVAENATQEPHRLLVSSIGVAVPVDKDTHGYLAEHHSFGETEEQAGEHAEQRAVELLAATLDLDFHPDESWDENKEVYRLGDRVVRTANVTQAAKGGEDDEWTTTVAAAVFLFDEA